MSPVGPVHLVVSLSSQDEESGDIFVFSSGSSVFWGVPEPAIQAWRSLVRAAEIEPVPLNLVEQERETVPYCFNTGFTRIHQGQVVFGSERREIPFREPAKKLVIPKRKHRELNILPSTQLHAIKLSFDQLGEDDSPRLKDEKQNESEMVLAVVTRLHILTTCRRCTCWKSLRSPTLLLSL